MEPTELESILKKCKTLRQVLNPSNTEAFVKWALETIPLVTQRAIDLNQENEKLKAELEKTRVGAKKPGAFV